MTIKEAIVDLSIKAARQRIITYRKYRLKNKITLIEHQVRIIKAWQDGKFKINDPDKVLRRKFYDYKIIGDYVTFNGGTIRYFPKAKYKRFIKLVKHEKKD